MTRKIKSKIKDQSSDFETIEAEARAYLTDDGWKRVSDLCDNGRFGEAIRIVRLIEDTYRDVARRFAERIDMPRRSFAEIEV